MDAHRDIFSEETAPKAIFSVGPIPGYREYISEYDLDYVHWDEPARAYNDLDRPLENVRLRMKKDSYWGGTSSRTHISEAMTNPTWRDVLEFATKGIEVTNDWHHVFLEAVYFSNDKDSLGREFVDLSMGS